MCSYILAASSSFSTVTLKAWMLYRLVFDPDSITGTWLVSLLGETLKSADHGVTLLKQAGNPGEKTLITSDKGRSKVGQSTSSVTSMQINLASQVWIKTFCSYVQACVLTNCPLCQPNTSGLMNWKGNFLNSDLCTFLICFNRDKTTRMGLKNFKESQKV